MGYTEWTGPELDDLARKIDQMEFDQVYVMDGSVLGFRHVDSPVHAPDVEHSEEHDLLIDGVPLVEHEDWSAILGMTGQSGYSGAVMHPSEYIGRRIAEHMSFLSEDEPRTFVACVVRTDDPEEYAGWCVLFRDNTVPDFKCLHPGN